MNTYTFQVTHLDITFTAHMEANSYQEALDRLLFRYKELYRAEPLELKYKGCTYVDGKDEPVNGSF